MPFVLDAKTEHLPRRAWDKHGKSCKRYVSAGRLGLLKQGPGGQAVKTWVVQGLGAYALRSRQGLNMLRQQGKPVPGRASGL